MARVLIVDDEAGIRRTFEGFLVQAGHAVQTAADADEALRAVAHTDFDVVVSDIILPKRSGVDLLFELRAADPDLPVILITGLPSLNTATDALRAGAFDYLTKPVGSQDLLRVVAVAAMVKQLDNDNRHYWTKLETLAESHSHELTTVNRRLANEKVIRQTMEDQRRNLVNLIENSHDLVGMATQSGRLTFLNRAARQALGLSSIQSLDGLNLKQFLITDNTALPESPIPTALEREGAWEGEARLIPPNGQPPRDVEAHIFAISPTHPDDKPLLSLVMHDITERKRQKLFHARFTAAIESTSDAILISSADGKPIFTNRAFNDLFDYSTEHLHEPNMLRKLFVDKQAMDTINDLILSGVSWHGEVDMQRSNGNPLKIQLRADAVRDDQGHIIALINTFNDITDKVHMELALRQSEGRFRSLVESAASIAVQGFDEHGRVVYWNSASENLYGYKTGEVWGKPIHELIIPEDLQQEAARELRDWITHDIPIPAGERNMRRKNGTPIDIYCSHAKQSYIDGRLEFYCLAIDLSERNRAEKENKRLESELQQAQRLESVGRMAGGIAHDFNNLLTGIFGNISLALMELEPEHPVTDTLREIDSVAKRAADLTRQLLAFSRRQIIEPKVIRLNQRIESLAKMLTRLIGEDISLDLKLSPSVGCIEIDPGQLEQCIVNLVVNARDAMPEGGRLLIETDKRDLSKSDLPQATHEAPEPYICLHVRDTGTGISPEHLDTIFEPFFTTKSKERGTGLGLSTVYGIVHQNNGLLKVESELGCGSEFCLCFKCTRAEPQTKPAAQPAPPIPKGSETILLVEDDPSVRVVAIRLLQRFGYNVIHACDGREALKLAENRMQDIDLLLSDVVMPSMTGAELARRLREIKPNLKVLFTSGYTDDVIVDHGVVLDGVQFIGKPFTPQSLATKLRQTLDG